LLFVGPICRFLVYQLSDSYAAFHVLPFCRVDTLAMGGLLAVCIDRPDRWPIVKKIGWTALVPSILFLSTITLLALGPWPMRKWEELRVVLGYSMVGQSCCTLVIVGASGGRLVKAILANPVVSYVGKISYGIYLWHCLLALIVVSLPIDVDAKTRLAMWIGLVVIVATASWYGIERLWLNRAAPAISVAKPRALARG
jgi:peptidoglycan/LPS O-acetylase OafA/YrhL